MSLVYWKLLMAPFCIQNKAKLINMPVKTLTAPNYKKKKKKNIFPSNFFPSLFPHPLLQLTSTTNVKSLKEGLHFSPLLESSSMYNE